MSGTARVVYLTPGIARAAGDSLSRTVGSRAGTLVHLNPWRPARPVNPWRPSGQVVDLRGAPVSEVLRAVARTSRSQSVDYGALARAAASLALDLHPWGTVAQAVPLVRELVAQLRGESGVSPMTWPNTIPAGQPGGWVFPDGWVLYCGSPSGSGPFHSSFNTCGAVAVLMSNWESSFVDTFTAAATGPNPGWRFGVEANFAQEQGPAPGPDHVYVQQTQRARWEGAYIPITSPEFAAHAPQVAPAAGLIVVAPPVYPVGSPERRLDAAQGLLLPGMGLPTHQLSSAAQAAVHAVREALGFREELYPVPRRVPSVGPRPELTTFPQNLIAGATLVTTGTRLALGYRHAYRRDRVPTKKIKVSGPAWQVFSTVMGWFTESNDLIEAIWKALPGEYRKAGKTKTGNRRTDSMLRDLHRGWRRVDWDEAFANIWENEIEDFLIGKTNQVMNRVGSRASGQGYGTTMGKLTDGQITSWASDVAAWATRPIREYRPIQRVRDGLSS